MTFRRFSHTLLQLFTATLLLLLSSILVADELSQALLESRIQAIQKRGDSAEIATTLGIYQEALSRLRETEAQNQSATGYNKALESSPQRQAEIRARLDTLDENASTITGISIEDLSWQELEIKINEVRTQLTETTASRDSLLRQITSEESSGSSIQARLEEIDQRETELPNIIVVVNPKAKPSQVEASQWLVAAERQLLVAERLALNARLNSQPARLSLQNTELEEANVMIGILQNDLASLETVMKGKDPFNKVMSLVQLPVDTPGYALVQTVVGINDRLAEQRAVLLEKLNSNTSHRDELKYSLDRLSGQYAVARNIVEAASESSSFGQILMSYWRKADQFRIPKSTVNVGREIGDQVISRAEHERQLEELASAAAYVSRLRGEQPDSDLIEGTTLELVGEQALVNRNRLNDLIDIESQLIDVLGEIELTQDQLNSLIKEYSAFLISHVLWVPSHSPIGKGALKQLVLDLGQTVDQVKSIRFNIFDVTAAVFMVSGLALFLQRKRLIEVRSAVNRRIGRPRSDSVKHTFLAFLLTILQAMALPLFIVALALSLRSSGESTSLDLSKSLLISTQTLFLILFWRTSCDQQGVARVHFRWSPASCDKIFNTTKWVLLRLWPLITMTSILVNLEQGSVQAILSRLVYSAATLVLGFEVLRFLRQNRIQSGNSPFIQKAVPGLVILLTLIPVVMVLAGFLLPSHMIFHSLIDTLSVITMLTFIYYILLRWLLVTQRQLRLRDYISQHKSEPDQQNVEASFATDLVELSKTTTELLKAVTALFGGLWLFYVLSPLLPAFEGLQRVTLWSVSEGIGDTQVISNITLATLLLAILIAIVTLYAARKLPALLELLLRSYSKMIPGTRYAAVTVLNYVIIGGGLVFLLLTLGLRWEKLQWLVAALSLGIGFGLQEIVANFISGLIILFERPIRVGDIVTVGESSGRVTRIQIRATTILDWDRKELLVPNKEFVTGRLLNWTLTDGIIRIVFNVGIAYGSDVETAIKTLYKVITSHEEVLKDPEPSVVFNEFGDSALTLSARCFITDHEERMRITSELHQRVDAAFRDAGISIAFPQRDVHFDAGSPIRVSIDKPDH